MSSKLPTTTANTVIIEDILDVMSKWKSCQQYLEHKPHHAGNLRDAGWLRKQLEEDLLLPALKNSANDVKDANTKLKEWAL
ncbi:hypothetical protein J4E91_003600 [Alternaria rosae]|nr:hypothetical protein J4E91_003600 [Alternaria rosae]